MSRVKSFAELQPADATLAGGKAFRCAEMLRAGLPVPDGVVLLADAPQTARSLADLQDHLRHWPADTLFAVRSSALDEDGSEHSFAGMHETVLNVAVDAVPDAVRACWDSVHAPRALAYREAQGVASADMRTAVVVQQMVRAVAAGVVFTADPVTGADSLVINAAAGLGDALVSGQVDPQDWHIRRSDLTITMRGHADKGRRNLLTDEQVRELCTLALRIEQLFGAQQDIEWCHDSRQFWIVQARPITGIRKREDEIEWTRANVREVLPELPPPQITDYVCDVLEYASRQYAGRLWAPLSKLGPNVKAFNGRPYFNVSQFRYLSRVVGVPAATTLRGIGHQEIRPEDEVAAPRPWGRFLRSLPTLFRIVSYQLRMGSFIRNHIATLRRRCDVYRREVASGDPERTMTTYMAARRPDAAYDLQAVFALSAVSNLEEQVRAILKRVPYSYDDLVPPQLAAGEKSVSSQQAFDLLRVAALARADIRARSYFSAADSFADYRQALTGTEFLRDFDRFLDNYGHRAVYETDWSRPRFCEDPTPLLATIATHVRGPSMPSADDIIAQQELAAAESWTRFESKLSSVQRLTVLPIVRALVRRIKQFYVWRELYRSEIIRVTALARAAHLNLAESLTQRGWLERVDDYFLLTFDEIVAACERRASADDVAKIVSQRRAEMESWRAIDMPLLLRESDLSRLSAAQPIPMSAEEFTGLCVSPGSVEAEVVVMHTADDFRLMKPGAIIVAPATDPSWTALFTLASGVIVEIGGLLSHASTVAREYGLPAVANVKNATRLLHSGDRIHLDASAGRIHLIQRAITTTPADTATCSASVNRIP